MISNFGIEVQTSPVAHFSVPSWFAEVVILTQHFATKNLLEAFAQQVRLVRGRFGSYESIDFFALLFGYAISGERTLADFFDRVAPFGPAFMALFGRKGLPHRSSLSRFLSDVDRPCLEAFRTLFEQQSFAEGWTSETIGGIFDRQGRRCIVFDVDATRQAARKPALPCDQALPAAKRRLDAVCAPGYTGRKRGEVVRTRTTVLQMHTRQWVGTYAGRGNGDYRGELASALRAISTYLKHFGLTPEVAQSASRWAIWRCGGDCAAHTSRRQSGDAREGLSHLGPSPTPAGARSSTDSTRDQDEHGRGPRAV